MRRALQIAGLGLSAMVSACAAAPEHPTWDDDVRPLMVARCIRCHGPGGVDPAAAKLNSKVAANGIQLDYQYLSDVPEALMPKMKALAEYARGTTMTPWPRMPPLPAAALEDWQIQMLENWGKDPR